MPTHFFHNIYFASFIVTAFQKFLSFRSFQQAHNFFAPLYAIVKNIMLSTLYWSTKADWERERAPIVYAFCCSVDNRAERKKTHLFTDKLVWTGSQ